MATQQLQILADASTLANYKGWAKAVSDWFRSAGYTNTIDSGQLNAANDGHGGTAAWAALLAAPGSGAYFYEIFKCGDYASLPTFYVKAEYGNVSGTNCPSLRFTLGTGTNGSGNLTGFVTTAMVTNGTTYTPNAVTPYECNFHRAADGSTNCRIAAMMWRNGPTNAQQIFGIERSIDESGVPTADYVSLIVGGYTGFPANFAHLVVHFVNGVAPYSNTYNQTPNRSGLIVRLPPQAYASYPSAFANKIVFDTSSPLVGYVGRPCTIVGAFIGAEIAEGVTFQITRFAGTITYMPSKAGPFAQAGPWNNTPYGVAMRYD